MTTARSFRSLGALAVICSAGSCSSPTEPNNFGSEPPFTMPTVATGLSTRVVATGLERPVYLTAPANDERLFIVEQGGRIRVVDPNGSLLPTPFLDLGGQVDTDPEGGLLTIAFHPQYQQNGFLYVNYTNTQGHSVIERYAASSDPNLVDPASASLIIQIDQPGPANNGGQIDFAADGMLYIYTGDGGGLGNPNVAQDPGSLLGKILRINVDGGPPYSIPSDNPFVGISGARGEVWAIGLRNPRRASAISGFVTDESENNIQEINWVGGAGQLGGGNGGRGANFGWPIVEGSSCFGAASCDQTGLTPPVFEYVSGHGCTITGGYVAGRLTGINGHYFFSDRCERFLRSFRIAGGVSHDLQDWQLNLGRVSSFGLGASAEFAFSRDLYVVDLDGTVSRIVTE